MRDPSAFQLVPQEAPVERPEPKPAPSLAMDLARRAAEGDVSATRKLLETVAPRMMRVVQVVLGGGHPDVDDVVQQSLIALVQALPSFRGECEPAHYGSRIAVRTAVAARKRARTLQARRDDAVDTDALVSGQEMPAEAAQAARRKTIVLELLAEIPDEQADSMAMRFVLGWSLEEVASATRAPVNTVRSRLRLAKEALRKRIEADPAMAEELGVDV
jgi:RNA polymerase sigma-70 factor (ECF subfamily)